MFELNEFIQGLVLLYILIYSLAFGIGNWYVRVVVMLTDKELEQSQTGVFLDYTLLVSILYFLLTKSGNEFLSKIIETLNFTI